ncbi:amino acid biosynthesis protein [Lactobacillus nasalidis]|uniref:Amino acid biosynthesis protein n=1 Tax=Lactobacillus nasalidis TaxID=2797258 RepID=A0ABQ3W6B9_9LACO|nr:hypothetical protein [Lactobacillus nasalidis]GHV96947.1 amino acid biosynthesis protein [Lactobacillus nasalidis]GHV98735.1 amino acid biosynthesis protein [Lactobacillus nasalidis]GHW02021.1 amino acid biosynthesis protein [Lactobacillus nasalidis]
MKLHTLGPEATDSWKAAAFYAGKEPGRYEIVGHASFEDILENLPDLTGDCLLIPAAFQSQKLDLAWGDMHYLYQKRLHLQDVFILPLNPMLLLENSYVHNHLAFTHAAVAKLLLQYVPDAKVVTCPSKYLAYQEYRRRGQYVLTNEQNVTLRPFERVLARIEIPMVWCVYQIK